MPGLDMLDVYAVFRIVADEFADCEESVVRQWITLTAPFISKKVFGKTYEQALALLTAHRMKMAGYGNATLGTVDDAMRVASYTEGQTSISFSTNQTTNLLSDGWLALTPYGLQYLAIRNMTVIPIRSAGEA